MTGMQMTRNANGRGWRQARADASRRRRSDSAAGSDSAARSDSTNKGQPGISLDSVSARLDELWTEGWHPEDLDRVLAKLKVLKLTYRDALSVNRQHWHPHAAALWGEQADNIGATEVWWNQDEPYEHQLQMKAKLRVGEVEAGLENLLSLFKVLQPQPLFEAPPNETGWTRPKSAQSDGVLAKVRALLAKAESTEYEQEAEAYSAKAQDLITTHSIDVALLADVHDIPGGRRVYIDNPYAKPKFILLNGIAQSNSCRCVWAKGSNTATLVGHQSDMLLVELLFTSLLLQGTGAVLAGGAKQKWDGSSSTKSWRNAFWLGYAGRIHERLREATAAAEQRHEAEQGRDYLPVLAKRSEAVEKAMSEAFPQLGTMRTSVSNREGVDAGRRFANSADLRSNRHVSNSRRPALGR